MNIARARPEDAPDMASVHAQAFDKPWDENDFEDLLDGEGIFGVLARGEGPAGVVICRTVAGEAEILTVGVAGWAYGRGSLPDARRHRPGARGWRATDVSGSRCRKSRSDHPL